MLSKAIKFLSTAAVFVGLYFFTMMVIYDDGAELITNFKIFETADIIDDAEGNIVVQGFDLRYDLSSEALDVNSLDFSDVTEINSEEAWAAYVDSCIKNDYHYIFFKADSNLTLHPEKLMKTNPVTEITIYTVPTKEEDTAITGYNLTYTFSYEILTAVKNGTTGSLDSKMQQVYNTAQSFVSTLSGSDYDKELAIHNYVCEKITYTSSSAGSDATNCYGGLILGQGNCQAYSDSFDLLCGLAGITSGRLGCVANGTDHSINYVFIDGQHYFVDCTFDDGISDPDRGYGMFYFNLSYPIISQDHSFESLPVSFAQRLDENDYYVRNEMYADSPEELSAVYAQLASSGSKGEILFNASNGDAALTDIFKDNPCGFTNISTQTYTFGSYRVLKFTLS